MSKKPQKIQNNQKKQQIVDQQNQPFLKTISKRVRNINKKLGQIADLQKKDDLKPEQLDKLKRRAEYEQQKTKLQGIADFFRESYAENAELYRNNQLQELDNLAKAVAILRGNQNFKQSDRLNELNRAITEPTTLSLAESTKQISEVFRRFANDFKLKKSLETFEGEAQSNEPTTQKVDIVEQTPVAEVKVEEPVKVIPQQPPVVVQLPPVEIVAEEKKVEEKVEVPQTVVAQEKPAETTKAQDKPIQGQQNKPRGNNRTRGEYRNRNNNNNNRGPREPRGEGQEGAYRKQGGERRRYNNDGNQERRQRPNYKPKEGEKPHESDSDSSLQKQRAMRTFKNEEIKKLQEEGFTVIGKPKPKAKQGQKQWHDQTHGKKYHKQHTKQNV